MPESTRAGSPHRQSIFGPKSFLILLLSLSVMAYILIKLEWSLVFETFRKIDNRWLILSFIVYLLNYILRALRFQHLFNLKEISFGKLLGVTSLYGMYLYLMPAKTGEISYPLLLKNRLGISMTRSTATLIVARFFDFATVSLFLPFVLAVFWQRIYVWIRVGAVVFVVLTLSTVFLTLWIIRSPYWVRFFETERFFRFTWLTRSANLFQRLFSSLREIDTRREYLSLWIITALIWLCVQANFYFIVLSIGYSLTLLEMMTISLIMVPMTLLPLQGFANLGTHELGWAAAFALFGYPQSVSLTIAVSTHIVLLIFVLLLGSLGNLLLIIKDA